MNQKVKDKLLDVGLDAIRQGGFSAVSIMDLVTEAEVPKGSFHYYFSSKEAFGVELVDHYIESIKSEAKPLLADTRLTAVERLRMFFSRFSQRMQEDGFKTGCLVGVMAMEAGNNSPLLKEKTCSCISMFPEFLKPLVIEGQETGNLRQDLSAEQIAVFIADAWQGALLRMKVQQDGSPLAEFDYMIFEKFLPAK